MKKILLICIAIIGFMQFASAQAVDVTETVLSNYICPFVSTGVQMHTGNARFMQLGDPWVVEGGVGGVIGDATYTSWHIDTGKAPDTAPYLGLAGGSFTITPGWDGFLGTFSDMKAYQTVTLDPGYYEFTATKAEQTNASFGVYLVAAKGAGIPNYADVATGLAATPFSLLAAPDWSVTAGFNLTETTVVSLGCVASFVAQQKQLTIAGFRLTKTDGVSTKPLIDEITKIKAFTVIQYPVANTYAQTQWDLMQTDVTNFQAFVDAGVYDNQPQITAKIAQLVADIHALDSVMVFPKEIIAIKALTNVQYPIGIIQGTFPKAKWDALQTAIGVASSFVATPPANQAAIDASRAALQTALSDLNGSMVLPFKVSTDATTYWYQLRDNRKPINYMEEGDYASTDGLTTYSQTIMLDTIGDNTNNAQLFKFVKAPSPSNGYNIYNKSIDAVALTAMVTRGASGVNQFRGDTIVTAFQFGRSSDAAHYTIFTEGEGQVQLNSSAYTTKMVGYWGHNPGDAGNQWQMVELLQAGQIDFTAFNAIVAKANAMNVTTYPIGNNEYQYPQAGWDVFTAQRAKAVAMAELAVTDPSSLTQIKVDAMIVALQATIDALNASMQPFFVSSGDIKYWYTIQNNDGSVRSWRMGLTDTYDKQLKLLAGAPVEMTDSVLFKFVKTTGGYAIYSKLDEKNPICSNRTLTYLAANDTLPVQDLAITAVPNVANYFFITNPSYVNPDPTKVLTFIDFNSYGTDKVWYWDGNTGSQWTFIRPDLTPQSVKTVSADDLGIYSKDRRIVCKDATAKLIVTSLLGQRIDARYQVAPGIYVVQIVGNISAAKLIVR